mgnify:FL=1|jgi:hypothetical protein
MMKKTIVEFVEVLVCNKCNIDLLGGLPCRFKGVEYDAWCFECDAPTNKVSIGLKRAIEVTV